MDPDILRNQVDRHIKSETLHNDFNTFRDFWKFPENCVSFNNSVEDSHPSCGYVNSVSPGDRGSSALHKWRGARFFASIPREESNTNPVDDTIYDEFGNSVNTIRVDRSEQIIALPFHFDSAVWNLRLEEYINRSARQHLYTFARDAYYLIKPTLPRKLQIAIRRKVISPQGKHSFPAWPVDISIEFLNFELLQCLLSLHPDLSLPVLSFWPGGEDFSLVITHDVESQIGFDNIHLLSELERKHGFRSSWNIVLKQYEIDCGILQNLISDGFEIGIHGLYHDGKMFQSKARFLNRAEQINEYLREWNCVGFRSPSNIRKLDWIRDYLVVEYDTSCLSTEWYGAQPGGSCTIFPFQYGNIIELPITLQQDHTLLDVHGFSPAKMVEHWLETIHIIRSVNGMALLNIHPDYMLTRERLSAYEEFLKIMKQESNCWHALPRDVARWWRERQQAKIVKQDDIWTIRGVEKPRGKVMQAGLDPGDNSIFFIQPIYV
jgi:peptidoglycan/xylan/chitin deacetylase (PgdA/CDA1 family)